MDELKIVKAEVSIHVLKVGNKSVTKAVFRQIPELATKDIVLAKSCLGYVKETYSSFSMNWFLLIVENTLFKISVRELIRKPSQTHKVEVKKYGEDALTETEYNDWVESYTFQQELLKDAIQLYIAT
jgi:hypothetical protein